MQIHVTFMEMLQLDGIPSVSQFEIKLLLLFYCIYSALGPVLGRDQSSVSRLV